MHLLYAKAEVETPARSTRIEAAYEILGFSYRTSVMTEWIETM